MKKVLLLFACLTFVSMQVFAQKTVTGTVTSADDGMGLPGVSVIVKGTQQGTITDMNGMYSIDVPTDATLVFQFMGMKTMELEVTGDVVNAVMESSDIALDDVIVTALGITKEEKSIGYAVQEVDGSKLTTAGESNVIAALSGRVAGVQMIGSPGAAVGGSAKIRIRGISGGLEGGDPLYVIDGTPISNENFSAENSGYDFGNLASDINADDIAKVTVLKGPSATALYGERASNGVIIITTKQGKQQKGVGIEFSTSFTWDKVYILPEYQNEYGGGYSQDYLTQVDPVDGQTYNVLNYSADESWGPKMDGTLYRPWWSWFDDSNYGTQIPMSSNPDNVKDFFETGLSNINSISFSGGTDKIAYRVGYTNLTQNGILPNSSFKKNNINVNLSADLTDKLKLSTNLNISFNKGEGRPASGYSPTQGSVMQGFNQWFQRQLDVDRMRDYRNADGSMRSWNMRGPLDPRPLYWDSPYFTLYENYETDSRNRYFGNVRLAYKFTDNLKLTGTVRRDNYVQRIEERIATGGLEQDFYSERVVTGNEDNYELLASYNNQWGDISLQAHAGGNLRKNYYHDNLGETVGGLNSADLFTLGASVDRPDLTSEIRDKEVRSIYGAVDFGFRDFLYLGFTARNDWSSALPADNNSYFYPSINLGFVFSELVGSNNILSFGKFRASVAQVGSDVEAYKTNRTFSRTTPYGSTAAFTIPDLLPNEDLKPAITTSWETGIDIKFLQDRIGLDFSYYNNVSKDQILEIAVSGTSGYASALINAGEIVSKGWEIAFNVVPVRGEFTWDATFNIAQNSTTVEELYTSEDGVPLTNYKLADGIGGQRWGGFSLNAEVGEEWGLMRGQGYTYLNGQKVVNPDGSYVLEANKDLGSALPDFTGGFTNTFTYKNFTLNAHIDFQVGGQFYSVTKMFNNYSGLGIETVGTNDLGNNIRDDVADGGGVRVDGVLADGTPTTVYVDAVSYYGNTFGLHEEFTYDASYIKLRELSLSYRLNSNIVSKTPFNSISLSLIARNLWLIHSELDGIDPTEIMAAQGNGGLVFEERGQLPGTRSFGFKLSIGL